MKKYVSILAIALIMSACTSATVKIKEGIVVEYGTEVKLEDVSQQESVTLKEVKDFDAKKVGTQTVTAVFDQDGKEITQEIKLEIKDTKNPEIILNKESIEITAGDKYDPKSNIKSVKDPVDGDIKYSDAKDLKKDGYQFTGEVKTDAAGTYDQKVIAYDVNGNKSEKSFKVTVKEKEEITEEQSTADGGTSTSGTAAKTNTGGGTSTGGGSTTPAPQPQQPEPTPEPTPVPVPTPTEPEVLCPNGIKPNLPCTAQVGGGNGRNSDGTNIRGVGSNGEYYSSEQQAIDMGAIANENGSVHGFTVFYNEYNDGTREWYFVDNKNFEGDSSRWDF